jgi:hypothetical protein
MTNKQIKNNLKVELNKLMKSGHHTAEIAARTGYSIRYIYHWWNSDLIHKEIEDKAIQLLEELRAEAKEKATLIKS